MIREKEVEMSGLFSSSSIHWSRWPLEEHWLATARIA